jgi:flagellin-specific chaperone FliS
MDGENNKYHTNLNYLKPGNWGKLKKILEKDGRKNFTKDSIQEEMISKNRSNIQKIKDKFPEVYEFMKTHKLNDNLNELYKFINGQIQKL